MIVKAIRSISSAREGDTLHLARTPAAMLATDPNKDLSAVCLLDALEQATYPISEVEATSKSGWGNGAA